MLTRKGLSFDKMLKIFLLSALLFSAFPVSSQALEPPRQSKEDAALFPAQGANGLWGYVDAVTRQNRIPPQFTSAGLFSDGFAVVRKGAGKAGLIDRSGREILPATHSDITRAFYYVTADEKPVLPGLFKVEGAHGDGLFDAYKGWIIPEGTCEEEIWVKEDKSAHCDGVYYDPGGRSYEAPRGFRIAQRDKLTKTFIIERKAQNREPAQGVMREDGSLLIPTKYHDLQSIPTIPLWIGSKADAKIVSTLMKGKIPDIPKDEDYITVEVLDASGKVLRTFRAGKYPYVSGETYEYISGGERRAVNARTGTATEAPPQGDQDAGFHAYKDGSKYGVKDKNNNITVKAVYGYIFDLGGGLFTVADKPEYEANNQGVIDGTGKVIIPFKYCSIEPSSYPSPVSGPLVAGEYHRIDGMFGTRDYRLIDRAGRVISRHAYSQNIYFNSSGQAEVSLTGQGGNGVIDYTGKEIIPPTYDSVTDELDLERARRGVKSEVKTKPEEALYTVEQNNLYGLYDGTGKELLPIKYGWIDVYNSYAPKGYALLENEERKLRGLFELSSGLVIPPLYDRIEVLPEGFIGRLPEETGPYDQHKFVFLNRKGKEVRAGEYVAVDWDPEINMLSARADHGHKYAILDPRTYKPITAAIYKYIEPVPPVGFRTDTGNGEELLDLNLKPLRMGN